MLNCKHKYGFHNTFVGFLQNITFLTTHAINKVRLDYSFLCLIIIFKDTISNQHETTKVSIGSELLLTRLVRLPFLKIVKFVFVCFNVKLNFKIF